MTEAMMMRVIGGVIFLLGLLAGGSPVKGQVLCIEDYLNGKLTDLSGAYFASDVKRVVDHMAHLQGIDTSAVYVLPCGDIDKVQYYHVDDMNGGGEYILFEPIWYREVVGPGLIDRIKRLDQAIVVFGHELGHIANGHRARSESMSSLQKELDADSFAGCAAAMLGVHWSHIEDLVERIRPDVDGLYPSREKALDVIRSQFIKCRIDITNQYRVPANMSPEHFLEVNVGNHIYFGDDSAMLGIEGLLTLRRVAHFLSTNPELTITIAGHDSRFDDDGDPIDEGYALLVSANRADAVESALVSERVESRRILKVAYGHSNAEDRFFDRIDNRDNDAYILQSVSSRKVIVEVNMRQPE